MAILSELTLNTVIHPDPLPRYPHKILVVHPVVSSLTEGSPAQGWEGDVRLAIYLDTKQQRFQLWRLEHDNQYRMAAQLPANAGMSPAVINSLIDRLLQHDSRRGFDANTAVQKATVAADALADKNLAEIVREHIAPKLMWALDKDGE